MEVRNDGIWRNGRGGGKEGRREGESGEAGHGNGSDLIGIWEMGSDIIYQNKK